MLVSTASVWEIAIKRALGKLVAPDDLPDHIEAQGFGWLPVAAAHAWRVRELSPHHRDPFDRLLVAQALCEGDGDRVGRRALRRLRRRHPVVTKR